MSCGQSENQGYALREIEYQASKMINICDIEIVGEKLEQGDIIIDLSREYFHQRTIENSEADKLLRSCSIANLVGERIVRQAINMKLARKESIKWIAGVPFLMIFKFQYI